LRSCEKIAFGKPRISTAHGSGQPRDVSPGIAGFRRDFWTREEPPDSEAVKNLNSAQFWPEIGRALQIPSSLASFAPLRERIFARQAAKNRKGEGGSIFYTF
jgi:hypothetical protein